MKATKIESFKTQEEAKMAAKKVLNQAIKDLRTIYMNTPNCFEVSTILWLTYLLSIIRKMRETIINIK